MQVKSLLVTALISVTFLAHAQRMNPGILNEDSLAAIKARDTLFTDKPVSPLTVSFSRTDLQYNNTTGLTPDTTLSDFHRINPVNRNSFASVTLGNIGLAEKKLYLYNPYPHSFRFRQDPYEAYYLHPENVRFYDTKSPYTDIYYTQTGKKEQIVRFTHSRSFKKYFNAGIDVQKIKSEGFYKRQAIDFGAADLFARYKSRSGRYQAAAAYMRNKAVVQENGGVDFDTIPLYFTGDKAFLPVRIQNASNTTKIKNTFFDQAFFLGKMSEGDSLNMPELIPFFGFSHSIAYDVKDDIYFDVPADQINYLNPIPTSGQVYDTLRVKNLSNTLAFHSVGDHFGKYLNHVRIYSKAERITVGQFFSDTTFNNIHFGLEAGKKILRVFNVFANSRLTATGYNSGDRYVNAGIETNRDSLSYYASLSFNSSVYEPDYMYKVNRLPVFKWYVDSLSKINLNEAKGTVSLFKDKLSLTGTYSLIDNYTYLDYLESPVQHRQQIQYYSAVLHGHITLWRKWHFVHDVLFQQVSDTNVIHIPDYAVRLTYYYNNRIFKKRLEVEAGLEVNYFDRFFADAYSPAIRSFYIQNSIQGGGYPYVDLFFKFKIRNRARIFFKYEHVNSGLVYIPYFTVPIYPQADRKLKIGVSWKFFD